MRNPVDLDAYLRECRALVLDDIARRIPRGSRADAVLYDLMMDYPLRPAKGLRPALCIAACRALGGSLEAVLPTASVLELYHNAFLLHDDVEDGSEKRRDAPTMHRVHGVPIAVNVGDAMLALALGPLLDNMRVLDMGRALRILQVVATMARESAEGQALELDWVRRARWDLTDDDYLAMVDQKTGWYSFVAPLVMGALAAGATDAQIAALEGFGRALGAAFQIQDDVLNLLARESGLREGKSAATSGRASTPSWCSTRCAPSTGPTGPRALAILAKARPGPHARRRDGARARPAPGPARRGAPERRGLRGALRGDAPVAVDGVKTAEEVAWLDAVVRESGAIAYARSVARARASVAAEQLAGFDWMRPSVHRGVLEAVVAFVIDRDR
jgi:geranylgeranyl diphosphate synthase type II